MQSSKSAKANSIKLARFQGMVAAYLNAAAVVFSLVIAFVVSPVVIAIITPNDLDRCISIGMYSRYCNVYRIIMKWSEDYFPNLMCVYTFSLS